MNKFDSSINKKLAYNNDSISLELTRARKNVKKSDNFKIKIERNIKNGGSNIINYSLPFSNNKTNIKYGGPGIDYFLKYYKDGKYLYKYEYLINIKSSYNSIAEIIKFNNRRIKENMSIIENYFEIEKQYKKNLVMGRLEKIDILTFLSNEITYIWKTLTTWNLLKDFLKKFFVQVLVGVCFKIILSYVEWIPALIGDSNLGDWWESLAPIAHETAKSAADAAS